MLNAPADQRLAILRALLVKQKLNGFILPVGDEFLGEYVPDSARRLAWLTGFSGSAGLAAVLENEAAFFTDGRYTLQAEAEVATGYELYNSGTLATEKWIGSHARPGTVMGYDPRLHTSQALRRYEKAAPQVNWKPVAVNPVDELWGDRPPAPASAVEIQPLAFAGESSAAKRARIGKEIAALGADAAVLTASDSIAWLFNIRGGDVPFTPFVLCYALLDQSGTAILYVSASRIAGEVREHLGNDVTVKDPGLLEADLAALAKQRILYDPAAMPVWFHQRLSAAGAKIIEAADPCQVAKAHKNKTEQDGMREAHRRDGLALTRFLCWLENAVMQGELLKETEVMEKLESFRRASDRYRGPSFATIAGSGPNGAIVHYRAHEATSRLLDWNSLLLVDSGGQYPDGTTDVTRTVALGNASAEMKDRFTRVLKGHIALARAVFPEGTSGGQLDTLARLPLWQAGIDFDHGTGHGVGSYLSVHEGPQRISKRGGDAPLEAGMVVSNEPGYYKAGEYGIRIENLVMVKDIAMGGRRFLGFDTLTLAPIDLHLVVPELLTVEEAAWLDSYHRTVFDAHAAYLEPEEAQWLKQATRRVKA